MFDLMERSFQKLMCWAGNVEPMDEGKEQMKILKKGPAMRVIFFYPGEEGTYVDHSEVTLYENGVVHIVSNQEETTTHLQNCEILWKFETDAEDRSTKVRLLKPKIDHHRATIEADPAQLAADKAAHLSSETHNPLEGD